MRGIKSGLISMLAIGLLAGSTAGVAAQDEATASPQGEPGLDVRELEWAPLDLDEATFGPGARLVDIAASDSMLVIGGSVGSSAAVWTSTDRMTWERVPHDKAVFGGPGDQQIKAIVSWRDGFVAAGEVGGVRDFDPLRVAVVWYSEDGTTWTRVPHDEKVFGGKGRQEMFDIAASDDRLVIVGFDEEGPAAGGSDDIAVWTSADGIDWREQTFGGGEMFAVQGTPDRFFATGGGGPWKSKDGRKWDAQDTSAVGRAWLAATAANSAGLVAVGSVADGPAVWTSPDGSDWSRATIDETVRLDDGVGLMDVASSTSGLAAVAGPGYYGGDSAVLVSADGKTWEQGDMPAGIADAGLQGITALGPHFVAIGGSRFDPDAVPSVWTTFEPESVLADEQSEADDVAATTSPDLLPGVDLVTEEVEPGVYRVLSDGVGHDMASAAPAWHTVGPDGDVVVFGSDSEFPDLTFLTHFFTLGVEGSHEFESSDLPVAGFFDAAVEADGALWAILDAGWGATNRLGVFDGSSWRTMERPAGSGLAGIEIGPDGNVWVGRTAQNERGPRVGRLSDGEWSRLPESDDPALQSYYSGGPFVIGPDRTLWFANGGIGPIRQDFRGLLRFEGEDWQVVVPDEERAGAFVNELAVGPDGTVWVYLVPGNERDKPRLARLGADGWEVFTSQDGVPVLDRIASPDFAVDAAGTLWIAWSDFGLSLDEPDSDLVHRCPGVLSFDGSEWTRYLVGVCVNHIEVGPQGSVWGSALVSEAPVSRAFANSEPATQPGGLYVITPGAVARAE